MRIERRKEQRFRPLPAAPGRGGAPLAGAPVRASRPRFRGGLAGLSPLEALRAAGRFAGHALRRGLLSMTLELTRRCNARCDFCDHWREPRRPELLDAHAAAGAVRRLDPLFVAFCGGEPLLRRDVVELVARVVAVPGWRFHLLITNGWLLTPALGRELVRAGLGLLNISLDFPDARHDALRGLPGLFDRIASTVPALVASGVPVNFNTVIMRDNLSALGAIARLAATLGCRVTYTLYSQHCNGNASHAPGPAQVGELGRVVHKLLELKARHGNITNSAYYLRTCVEVAGGARVRGCPAGGQMIHVSPRGMVKPCADLDPVAAVEAFAPRRQGGVDCDRCWMACRGEVQAPVDVARMREVIGV